MFFRRCSTVLSSGVSHLGYYRTAARTQSILSKFYPCDDDWSSCKQCSALQKTDSFEFISEVRKKYIGGSLATAVDVDIAVNCVTEAEQLDDIKLLLYRLRHTRATADTLDSTHHAVARNFLKFDRLKELMQLLADPINYGIFLDNFAANILMDGLIGRKDYQSAAKIAAHMMREENFSNRLTCFLSLYSCLMWLKNRNPEIPWEVESVEIPKTGAEKQPQEDEEFIIKIPWLKIPHFDDHFDIFEPNALIGKTIHWMAEPFLPSDLAQNFIFIGLGLRKKFSDLNRILSETVSKKRKIFQNTAALLAASLEDRPQTQKNDKDAKVPAPGEKIPEIDENLKKLKMLLSELENYDMIVKKNVEDSLLEQLQSELPNLEKKDIDAQKATYQNWHKLREDKLRSQILTFLKEERLRAINAEKEKLKEQEELLYFFENKDKLEQMIDPRLAAHEAERKKQLEAGGLPSDEEYIQKLPEIKERRKAEDQRPDWMKA